MTKNMPPNFDTKEGVKSEEILKAAVNAIEDKKGNNIISLEFTEEMTTIGDYFVICDANNNIQAKAIADNIYRQLRKELKISPLSIEGYENAEWILMDYADVIIHIFLTETRNFYGLEKLWADARIKNYSKEEKK